MLLKIKTIFRSLIKNKFFIVLGGILIYIYYVYKTFEYGQNPQRLSEKHIIKYHPNKKNPVFVELKEAGIKIKFLKLFGRWYLYQPEEEVKLVYLNNGVDLSMYPGGKKL